MKLKLLFLLSATFFAKAQTPELLYYNFENITGTTVPNLATTPPSGTANATIVGSLSVGNNGICPGNALVGTSTSSTTDYLNTNWSTSLSGSWSIHLKLGNYVNTDTTLYYFFGDTSSGFRFFTNGVAGANNIMLRGNSIPDMTFNSVFDNTQASQKDIIITYDTTTGVFKGYLNGVLVTTVNGNPGLTINGGAFKVGGYSSNTGLKTGMTLDEFGLYNRAISATEAATLAANCGLLSTNENTIANKSKFIVKDHVLQLTYGNIGVYEIYDMSGKMILSNATKSNQIDISVLPKGVYIIKTTSLSQRFIK